MASTPSVERRRRPPPALGPAVAALAKDRAGATAIEYAIMAGGIALAIVLAVAALSVSVEELFEAIAAAFG
jgi:Flp pilus assembly pilin Flp